MPTQPTALDTMDINGRTYTFVVTPVASGQVAVGADVAAARLNIVAAINGTDGLNTAHPDVTAAAFVGNDMVLTAKVKGTAGDAITTTENFTAVGNVFDAATLGTTTAGVDCTAANGVTALAAAVTGDASAEATAVDGAGDTVDVTALSTGTGGNSIATTETMANGSFGAATLTGGKVANELYLDLTNATAETVTLRFGEPAVAGLSADHTNDSLDVTHAAP